MSNSAERSRGGPLDPIDRNSEILFGLFMVLTFTGTLSAATAGREDVRIMLLAAIGCNAAGGIVDGVMYILRSLVERGHKATLVREVRAAAAPEAGQRLIAAEMGDLASPMTTVQLEHFRQWIVQLPAEASAQPRLLASDLCAACGVFVLVFMSTFPVVLPFMFVDDLRLAMRWSSAIAIAMMFLCGYGWARYAEVNAWLAGLAMLLFGVIVESVVVLLGGCDAGRAQAPGHWCCGFAGLRTRLHASRRRAHGRAARRPEGWRASPATGRLRWRRTGVPRRALRSSW